MKIYITTDSNKRGQVTGRHWEDNYFPKTYKTAAQAQRFCPENGGVYTVSINCPDNAKFNIGEAYKQEIAKEASRLGIEYWF